MSSTKPQDNSTYALKSALRIKALRELENPVVMETHGGYGKLFDRCYSHIREGVVFETKPEKTAVLARQRPTWAVYEADCLTALRAGAGAHLPVNFLDLDPYGEPWPVLDAFLETRKSPDKLVIVVNDGLRQMVRLKAGWHVKSLQGIVERLGNDVLFDQYLEICQDLIKEKAGKVGYRLMRWTGYYTGEMKQMTHYAAVLERP
jgi:hypothetical protein